MLALILTPALVLLDEYWLDLPALLPSLPTIISNGWVPLAALLLGLMAIYELLRRAVPRQLRARRARVSLSCWWWVLWC